MKYPRVEVSYMEKDKTEVKVFEIIRKIQDIPIIVYDSKFQVKYKKPMDKKWKDAGVFVRKEIAMDIVNGILERG